MRRVLLMVVLGALMVPAAVGCADENFTRDVEARWCELVGVDCAPPPPLQPPVLNQPTDAYRPAGPIYEIPPVYTAPGSGADAG